MSDSLAIYTYTKIALIKAVDPELAARLRRKYSDARTRGGRAEQRIGEQIEDLCTRLRREGKIAP